MSTHHLTSTEHHSSLAAPGQIAASQSYGELVTRGLTPAEAGTLAAYLEGLDVANHAWTLREVNGLLFLRHLNRANRFRHDDPQPSS